MSKSALDAAFGLCADEPYTPKEISVLDHGYVKLCESLLALVVTAAVLVFFIRRASREFRRGYLLALDHIEFMTRPGKLGGSSLEETLAKLRAETVEGEKP